MSILAFHIFKTSSSCPGFPGQLNAFPVFTMLSRDFPCFRVIFEAFGEVSPLQVSSRKKAWDFPGFNSTFQVFGGICFLEAVLFLLLYCRKESCRGEKNIMHSLGPMSEFFQVFLATTISTTIGFRALMLPLRYLCKSKIILQSKFQPNRTSGSRDIAIFFKI